MAQNKKLRDQTVENANALSEVITSLNKLTVRIAHLGETLAAIVSHLGEDVIQAKIQELKDARHAKHEAELEKSVQFLVDNELGKLAPEGALVEATSFVVGDEVQPNGTRTRIQHEVKRLDQAGQKRYIGKKVGDEVSVEGFPTKVVIRAIYQLDMAKIQEFAARKRAEAIAAQAAQQNPPAAEPTPTAQE